MKIAVTGGTGFLGREVVSTCGTHCFVVLGRSPSSDLHGCEYRQTDYSKGSLREALRDCEAVAHLAAKRAGALESVSNYVENMIITENLYAACVDLNISNIVFASSISVYSDVTCLPWTESVLPSPVTMYGVSKLCCEQIGNICNLRHGLHVKALRIAHILGEGERRGYMMNTFIDNAFEKKPLNVIGKSIAKREYVYVKDAAAAVIAALYRPNLHGVFNAGGGQAYTIMEIATAINDCFGNTGNIAYASDRPEAMQSSYMSSDKARDALGYLPRFTLHDGLDDIKKIKHRICKHASSSISGNQCPNGSHEIS